MDGRGCEGFYPDVVDAFAGLSCGEREEQGGVMIRVGIAGAAGYTAGELIRILISHPQVELRYLQSESHRAVSIF